MTNNLKAERTLTAFDAWFNEQEGYSLRSERFEGDVEWLKAAFEAGALSTQQPMGEVRVKALKWVEYPNSLAPDYFGHAWEAETPFGRYVVEEASGSDSPVYETNFRYERLIAATDGLPEAKAAAEADYSKRVLSALHPNQESGE